MFIIEVIPIAKGMGKERLSYYTSQNIPPGAVVSVPLRKKSVSGIVVTTTPAKERKADIKSSDFTIRKADDLVSNSFLDNEFVDAANETARYFATSTGNVLKAVLPNAILEDVGAVKPPRKKSTRQAQSTVMPEKFLLQTQPEDRLAHYKSLIREDFARKKSVFFCLPTIEDISKTRQTLEKGIEQYTYILHSSVTKKEIRKLWNSIVRKKHPVLIIATPLFLSIPRHDLGTIIMERESSTSYKQQPSPFLDMRTYAEFVSKARGVRYVLGDTLLRIETLKRYRNLEFAEYMSLKYRLLTSAKTSLIDMKRETVQEKKEKKFLILSKAIRILIENALENSERLFLFTTRRGLAPVTVCGDCGTAVSCDHCNNPVVLHEHKTNDEKNTFLCHKCGVRRSAHETCRTCGSWRLRTLGIGTELVAKEVQRQYPNCSLYIVDKDHTKTYKQAQKEIDKFSQTPGSILVGTEMALLYLSEQIENIAVVSLDSLFSIPNFRINERIINILTSLRILAQKVFLVQSRNADQTILHHGLAGNLIEFYREEIAARKQFAYPPFTVLIKVTRQGKQRTVEEDMRKLEEAVGKDNITVYPATPSVVKGKHVMNGLIKVPREKWVDKQLVALLCSLPPQFIVRVDPDSLL